MYVCIELKMAVSRIQIASNKKAALLKQNMREIAVMLSDDPPKEEKAKIRAEALIRDDHLIEAYEILQLQCELLHERIKLIDFSKECPPDLVPVISTMIWASHRVDIPELTLIRKQFRAKYGKTFEEAALKGEGGVLNERVVAKLSVDPPAAYLVQTYLERICEQFEVDWKPRVRLSAQEMIEPMAAPVGYSVAVAQGTGLGAGVAVMPPPPVVDGSGGDGSGLTEDERRWKANMGYPVPPPVVTAQPYVPSSQASMKNLTNGEADIYIPPSAPSPSTLGNSSAGASAATKRDNGNDDDDNDDGYNNKSGGKPAASSSSSSSEGAGAGGGVGKSYADLAARFDQLNK
jgi:Regulator of Vps4 activity in the MVB pathway